MSIVAVVHPNGTVRLHEDSCIYVQLPVRARDPDKRLTYPNRVRAIAVLTVAGFTNLRRCRKCAP